jgi:hypothetical protein
MQERSGAPTPKSGSPKRKRTTTPLSRRASFFGTPSYDLEILDVAYDASSLVSSGSALPVSVTVKNSSNIEVTSVPLAVFLSSDTSLDAG